MIGIGIDTGGTCTDAVIYDFYRGEVLAAGKALTTKQNLEIGIANALDTLPPELVEKAESVAAARGDVMYSVTVAAQERSVANE